MATTFLVSVVASQLLAVEGEDHSWGSGERISAILGWEGSQIAGGISLRFGLG